MLAVRRSEESPIKKSQSLPAAGERIRARQSPLRKQLTLGGHGGRQTTHAAEAQCQCTTASQGTAGHAAYQAW